MKDDLIKTKDQSGSNQDQFKLEDEDLSFHDGTEKKVPIQQEPRTESFSLEDLILELIPLKKVSGFVFEGKWYDVGNPDNYEKAIKEFILK